MSKYKRSYCKRVVSMGRRGKSLSAMAAAMGTTHQALIGWARQFPEFKYALELARDAARAYWEERARKAIIRSCKPVHAQDERYNKRRRRKHRRWRREQVKQDLQLFVELRRRFPEDYGEPKRKRVDSIISSVAAPQRVIIREA
jgi:hypothetical protein